MNPNIALFAALHIACLAAFFTGVQPVDLAVAAALYALRMFGVTAGYHRYFAHRTFRLRRVPQLLLAILAQSSGQKSVLWWAAHHRHHHRHSDRATDLHSPRQRGFWYSHVGWILDPRTDATNLAAVRDLTRFPELVFLHRHEMLPSLALAFVVWAALGWSGLVVGFVWSTVLLWHATFTINSLSHVFGSRRFDTGDDSRNNFWLALLTFGEGWHNNHHHYPSSTRQGFRWWEIDLSWYALRLLAAVGVVRDMHAPPDHVRLNLPHPLNAAPAHDHASAGEHALTAGALGVTALPAE